MVQDLVHNLCDSLVENIGGVAGVSKKTPPTPITYLTQWKIVGNSEVHGNEIWSCGEYNSTDGKYHILVQPLGGSIADIALTEPLRKVNNVVDTIEFPSDTEGKALVTRNIASAILSNLIWNLSSFSHFCLNNALPIKPISIGKVVPNIMIEGFTTYSYDNLNANKYPYGCTFSSGNNNLCLYDDSFYEGTNITQEFRAYIAGKKIIYELATPTTELVDAPQIAEAENYTCVISQGGKAVGWSEFIYALDYGNVFSRYTVLGASALSS